MSWQLAADEPPAFTVLNAHSRTPFFLVADHASARIPQGLYHLGLPAEALERHIAYDLGIEALARALAARLDATLVMSNYSRLVMDMNRTHDAPTRVVELSDGQRVPGNLGLDAVEVRRRTRKLFVPYHKAIRKLMHERGPARMALRFVSLHSFTPLMNGVQRPWDIGVLWHRDEHLSQALIHWLRERGDLMVGDNQPYSGTDPCGYTVPTHAEAAGIANALLEIRQDQLADEAGVQRWCDILAEGLAAVDEQVQAHPSTV